MFDREQGVSSLAGTDKSPPSAPGLLWQLRPSDVEVELLAHTRRVVSRELEEETGLHTGWIQNGGLFIASSRQRLDEYKRLMSVGAPGRGDARRGWGGWVDELPGGPARHRKGVLSGLDSKPALPDPDGCAAWVERFGPSSFIIPRWRNDWLGSSLVQS